MSTFVDAPVPAAARRGFWRLVWKEFRQYRAVIITLLATGLLLQLFALAAGLGSLTILLVAGVFPVMCCLAISATAFAGEHDNATFLGLRALPASSRDIVAAKLLVAAGAALTVFFALWSVVILFREQLIGSGQAVEDGAEVGEWLFSSLAMIAEMLVYGSILSLFERNALVAVVKTIAVVFLIRFIAFAISALTILGLQAIGWTLRFEPPDQYINFLLGGSLVIRGLFAAAGIVVIFRAARQWYSGGQLAVFPGLARWRDDMRPRSYTVAQTGPGDWRRLGWLQIRYFGWVSLTMVGGAVGIFVWEQGFQTMRGWPKTEISIATVILMCLLAGGLTYRAAQAQKNFLATLGVAPWRIWLCQLWLPAATCAALIGLFAGFFRLEVAELNLNEGFFWGFAIVPLSLFTWGQLCSQQTRATLPALAWSALAATLVGIACFSLYRLSFDSPRWQRWGLVAIAVYPLLESFLRAPGWITGTDVRAWRWIGIRTAVFSLAAAGLLWNFETEIPYVSNEQIGLAQNGGVRPDTSHFAEIAAIDTRLQQSRRETTLRVQAANPNVDVSRNELQSKMDAAWFAANQQELERLLSLPYENFSAQSLFHRNGLPENGDFSNEDAARRIIAFMRVAFKQVVDAGDVDTAERILRKGLYRIDPVLIARWAWLDGNDAERIRGLIRYVQTELDPRQYAIWYLSGIYDLTTPANVSHRLSRDPLDWLRDVIALPRENRHRRQRAFQLPDVIDSYRRAIDSGAGFYHLYLQSELADNDSERLFARNYYPAGTYVAYVRTQRFVTLQLAAIAWKREHPGEQLELLEQLVPGYLSKIPSDPYTGEPPIFERGFETRVYPESVWMETPSPTSSTYLFSPGGFGVEKIKTLVNVFRNHPKTALLKPDLAWGYRDREYYFYLTNANLAALYGRQNSIVPGDRLGSIFPIELSELGVAPSATDAQRIAEEKP